MGDKHHLNSEEKEQALTKFKQLADQGTDIPRLLTEQLHHKLTTQTLELITLYPRTSTTLPQLYAIAQSEGFNDIANTLHTLAGDLFLTQLKRDNHNRHVRAAQKQQREAKEKAFEDWLCNGNLHSVEPGLTFIKRQEDDKGTGTFDILAQRANGTPVGLELKADEYDPHDVIKQVSGYIEATRHSFIFIAPTIDSRVFYRLQLYVKEGKLAFKKMRPSEDAYIITDITEADIDNSWTDDYNHVRTRTNGNGTTEETDIITIMEPLKTATRKPKKSLETLAQTPANTTPVTTPEPTPEPAQDLLAQHKTTLCTLATTSPEARKYIGILHESFSLRTVQHVNDSMDYFEKHDPNTSQKLVSLTISAISTNNLISAIGEQTYTTFRQLAEAARDTTTPLHATPLQTLLNQLTSTIHNIQTNPDEKNLQDTLTQLSMSKNKRTRNAARQIKVFTQREAIHLFHAITEQKLQRLEALLAAGQEPHARTYAAVPITTPENNDCIVEQQLVDFINRDNTAYTHILTTLYPETPVNININHFPLPPSDPELAAIIKEQAPKTSRLLPAPDKTATLDLETMAGNARDTPPFSREAFNAEVNKLASYVRPTTPEPHTFTIPDVDPACLPQLKQLLENDKLNELVRRAKAIFPHQGKFPDLKRTFKPAGLIGPIMAKHPNIYHALANYHTLFYKSKTLNRHIQHIDVLLTSAMYEDHRAQGSPLPLLNTAINNFVSATATLEKTDRDVQAILAGLQEGAQHPYKKIRDLCMSQLTNTPFNTFDLLAAGLEQKLARAQLLFTIHERIGWDYLSAVNFRYDPQHPDTFIDSATDLELTLKHAIAFVERDNALYHHHCAELFPGEFTTPCTHEDPHFLENQQHILAQVYQRASQDKHALRNQLATEIQQLTTKELRQPQTRKRLQTLAKNSGVTITFNSDNTITIHGLTQRDLLDDEQAQAMTQLGKDLNTPLGPFTLNIQKKPATSKTPKPARTQPLETLLTAPLLEKALNYLTQHLTHPLNPANQLINKDTLHDIITQLPPACIDAARDYYQENEHNQTLIQLALHNISPLLTSPQPLHHLDACKQQLTLLKSQLALESNRKGATLIEHLLPLRELPDTNIQRYAEAHIGAALHLTDQVRYELCQLQITRAEQLLAHGHTEEAQTTLRHAQVIATTPPADLPNTHAQLTTYYKETLQHLIPQTPEKKTLPEPKISLDTYAQQLYHTIYTTATPGNGTEPHKLRLTEDMRLRIQHFTEDLLTHGATQDTITAFTTLFQTNNPLTEINRHLRKREQQEQVPQLEAHVRNFFDDVTLHYLANKTVPAPEELTTLFRKAIK